MKNKNISDGQLEKYFRDELPEAESHLVKKMLLNDMLAWHRLKKTEEAGMNQSDLESEVAPSQSLPSNSTKNDSEQKELVNPTPILKRKLFSVRRCAPLVVVLIILCPTMMKKSTQSVPIACTNKNNEKKQTQSELGNKKETKPNSSTVKNKTEKTIMKNNLSEPTKNTVVSLVGSDKLKDLQKVVSMQNSITPFVLSENSKDSLKNTETKFHLKNEGELAGIVIASEKQRAIDTLIINTLILDSGTGTSAQMKFNKKCLQLKNGAKPLFEDCLDQLEQDSSSIMNQYLIALCYAKKSNYATARKKLEKLSQSVEYTVTNQELIKDIQRLQELVKKQPDNK